MPSSNERDRAYAAARATHIDDALAEDHARVRVAPRPGGSKRLSEVNGSRAAGVAADTPNRSGRPVWAREPDRGEAL